MLQDILSGTSAVLDGIRLIRKYRLWLYMILPGLISLIVGVGAYLLIFPLKGQLGDFLLGWWPWEWGSGFIEKAELWLGGALITLFFLFIYKYLVLILAGPFMSLLSEQLEHKMYPERPSTGFSIPRMLRETWRGLVITLRNIFREIGLTILLLLSGLIPGMQPIVPVAIFLVQAYYAGFGAMDYTLERYYNIRETASFVGENRALTMGMGAGFLLLLFIPVLGFLLAPPLITAGSTPLVLERIGADESRYEKR